MHFVEAAATAAWRSRMCRWWFAARNSSIRYAFTCNRGLLARQSRIVFNTRPFFRCFFLFTEGSMKFVGGMHHHKYNGMSFFVINEFAIEFFFPAFIPHPRFCKYIFLWNSFSLMFTGLKRKKNTDTISNFVQFSVSPCEFISSGNRDFFVLNWR